MAGIFSALSTAFNITESFAGMKSGMSGKEKAEYLRSILKKTSLITTDGSLTKLLGNYTVEPFIIVSKDAKESEIVDKVIEANLDLFASYYMQAFNILTSIEKLDVSVAVRLLGTDNAGLGSVASNSVLKYLSREDYQDEVSKLMASDGFLSTEADTSSYRSKGNDLQSAMNDYKQQQANKIKNTPVSPVVPVTPTVSKSNNKPTINILDKSATIRSNDSLNKISDQPTYGLLQRNIEVVLSSESVVTGGSEKIKSQIVVPIVIRALIVYVSRDGILNMLAPNSRDKTFSSRLDEYRAGAINFKEMIFAGDLINKYKVNRLKDKEGLIRLTNERILSANAKVMENGVVGFEKYYNMLVITNEDKVAFNKHIGGDISNEKYKQTFMNQAHAIVTTILDDDYERVNMLIKDIRGSVDVGYKTLSKRKNKDLDITELLKAFSANKPPVF